MPTYTSFHKRNIYLDRLIAAQDTGLIKMITGVRRSGKTSLLKMMIAHLLETGISDEQILEMSFESYEYSKMSGEYFFHYVRNRVCKGKRTYMFFDELQMVPEWAEQISAFMVAFDCDIYISGSNASLLSTEFKSYLSKKSIVIRVFPLSFSEFLDFHGYTLSDSDSADVSGNQVLTCTHANGTQQDVTEVFDNYLRYGGMPIFSETHIAKDNFTPYLDGVYSTIILRDILERERSRGQQLIKDPALLKKIILYVADKIGLPLAVSAIGNALVNEGLLFEGGRENAPSAHTVQAYVNSMLESYLFHEAKRFDIKSGEYLRTLGRYYMADCGLRNYLLGFENYDSERALQNIVYMELTTRGYETVIGKIGTAEIDFLATKGDEKLYIQVTRSMATSDDRKRCLSPLKRVRDNYEKIVLSLEPDVIRMYDGIKSIPLITWLLE